MAESAFSCQKVTPAFVQEELVNENAGPFVGALLIPN